MKIAFDAVGLLGPMSKNRGIGNYSEGFIKSLIQLDRDNEYFFFNIFEAAESLKQEKQNFQIKEKYFEILKNQDDCVHPGFIKFYTSLLKAFLKKNDIDVFVITSPFDGHVPSYQKEWFGRVKTVAICYDIIPYIMKDHYFASSEAMKWYLERFKMLRKCDKILVISQSVKDDLVNYLSFDPEQIDVIWGATSSKFQKVDISSQQKNTLFKKFGIAGSFIMDTGGDDERKNISRLVEAYAKLPESLIKKYQLVIVCKLQKSSVERYTELIEQNNVKNRVILTNFVSDQELVALYNLASLVAFPSTYEGFGLPVIEAWSCGTPVLTSNNSSLVQIAGDAAWIVDPYSVESIAEGLKSALLEGKLLEMQKKGEERLKLFQWEAVGRRTLKALSELGEAQKNEADTAAFKKRIAFFTPLPPIESGISDYSVDIINKLAKWYDIDVFIDDGYEPNCNLVQNVSLYRHSEYENKKDRYFDTIFQIGNNTYHVYMWDYIHNHGGTVVLHDYNLYGIFNLVRGNTDLYAEFLSEDYSLEEYKNLLSRGKVADHVTRDSIEANGYLVNYATRIIVHSHEAMQKLLERDAGRKVSWVKSYANIEPLPDKGDAREKLGLPNDQLIFAAFGHAQETKRIFPIIKAFWRLAKNSENIKLILVGKLASGLTEDYEKLISKLNLENYVTVTGYVDLTEFNTYMDAADICLNLRWPYNGETSASLIRLLAKGKSVIVNDIGSFKEIPDEACYKLPSVETMTEEQEVNKICEAMKKLATDNQLLQSIQVQARKFAEQELDIKKVIQQYISVIEEQDEPAFHDEDLIQLKNIIQNQQYSDEQIKRLAETLAYL